MSLTPQLNHTLESLKFQLKDAFWALSSCICQESAKVKINGRTFKVVKVLGEGGFSFVYLVQDEHSGRQFALKKIRCPSGNEDVRQAMREVEAYRRFKHPNIIRILDSAVVQDPSGDGQIVYLFLPLYKRGNLQDAINANLINRSQFPEKEMLLLFKGTCEAVRAMHDYQAPIGTSTDPFSSRQNQSQHAKNTNHRRLSGEVGGRPVTHGEDDEDDEEDELFPQPEGDGDGGYSYHGAGSSRSTVPLVTKSRPDEGETIYDGDEELSRIQRDAARDNAHTGETELVPYAHRDLKPGNVMIADNGAAILMDFGSCMKARVKIENRSQALLQQDIAAEQSTMAYRAPELFDVKTGVTIDEKVDIWSLGCTLFALAYSHSPFENTQTTEQGGSIAMAVMNAQYKHPNSAYSQGLKDLIDAMLKADPQQRPDIHKVLEMTENAIRRLS
ncbi:Pkinase-domain-containing protein [Cristinia sonorae]|uniref:non-specific serine/threonine protein kinase n=1 Tax=Cristinia sonorae TaxID=1940300 RepID=A0A8K0UMG8_9AGAR|nr:Pkinase-domain-containing protein [Cristinia sonorae]